MTLKLLNIFNEIRRKDKGVNDYHVDLRKNYEQKRELKKQVKKILKKK